MSLKIDKVQLDIVINNDQARKQMRALSDELHKAQLELRQLPRGSQEWIDKTKEMDAIKARMKSIVDQIGITGLTMKELIARQKELNMVMLNMDPNLSEYKKLQHELSQVNARVKELRNGANQTEMSLGKIADGFNKYFNMGMVVFAAAAGIAYTVQSFIMGAADLSDSLADVQKTSGLSAQEVKNLNTQLGKIDTRTSRKELRDIAVVAGQLGIAKEQIYSFVDSVDKLNVALSDEISGGAEEVASIMGKLRNVLTDMKTSEVDQDMLRIGNALNELGKAGFATSPVVADFANRIGGVGISLGLTSDQVLGMSATLQELNVSTERGGTAVSKILQKMARNTEDFSKIAGIPVKEFAELVNEDLMGAFIKVVEGSKRGGESATVLAGIIKELEIQGAGASEVFAKLGNNTAMLREKIDLSARSLQGTSGILDEFNIKNTTLGASVDKLIKSFYGLITMPSVVNFLKGAVLAVVDLVAWFKALPQTIEKYKVSLTLLSGVILSWIAISAKGLAMSMLNNIALKEGIGLKIKDAVVLRYLIIQEALQVAMVGKVTIAQKIAAIATVAWNTALSALGGPIGWVIMGVSALAAGIKAYDKYSAESIQLEKEKSLAVSQLGRIYRNLEDNYNRIADKQRIFSRLSIQEKKDLSEKIDLTLKQAEAELVLLEAKQEILRKNNSKPTNWQAFKNLAMTGGSVTASVALNVKDAVENGIEAADLMTEGIDKIKQSIKGLRDQKLSVGDILQAESIGDAIGTATIEELEQKMGNYNTALRNAVKGGEDYIRIQKKISEVNKQLGTLLPGTDNPDSPEDKKAGKEKRAAEKKIADQQRAAENYKKSLDSISQFEAKQTEERMTGFLKEVAAVERKYDAEIQKAREYIRLTSTLSPEQVKVLTVEADNLEVNKQAAVKELMLTQEQKFTEEVIKLRNKLVLTQLSGYEQEIQEIDQTYQVKISAVTEQMASLEVYYSQELFLASGNADELSRIEAEKAMMLNALHDTITQYSILKSEEVAAARLKQETELNEQIKKASADITNQAFSEKQRELQAIDDKYAKMYTLAKGNAEKTAEIEKLHADEVNEYMKNQRKEVYQQLAGFASEQAHLIATTVFTIQNKEREHELSLTLSALDKEKDKELSNKKLTAKQREAIEERYHKKEVAVKQKAWKAQQDAAETQAIINGALAVVNILATMPWVTFGIMQAIAIAGSIASTIAQVSIIRGEKMPEFFEGGYTSTGDTRAPAGIVHKGEYVIPATLLSEPTVKKAVDQIEAKRMKVIPVTSPNQYFSGGFVSNGSYTVSEHLMESAEIKELVRQIDSIKTIQSQQVNTTQQMNSFADVKTVLQQTTKMRILSLSSFSDIETYTSKFAQSVSSITESTGKFAVSASKIPSFQVPSFNIPQIQSSVRMAPVAMQYELMKQQTYGIAKPANPSLGEESITVLKQLNKTLSSGIHAKMVYSEWDKTRQSVDKMISDTSI